ncbi:hypothetical protein [Glycomyces niveus]|uniref:DUF222 domain-containing protein n=1 Tax=Glycomyces niveus TaxID=2820287 RepID=A0ABS3U516_9ACTN|nr:hypothetical protein [Glycomyces sp. NEAU-S30]MBO3732782.1 hypothetical protein [Glycomyces sp. NEAU-S30]
MSEILSWSEEQHLRATIAESCAAGLAEHLAGEWVRCDPHEHLVALRSGERRLTIRPERKAALWRVEITADLPQGYQSHTRLEVERTSVAPDRPADKIARQVERRLLTDAYDAACTEVLAALDAERDRKTVLATAVAELQALIPGAYQSQHDSDGSVQFSGPNLFRGSFRLHYRATEATIKLDGVPIDLARNLAALIGKHLSSEITAAQVS